MKNIYCKIGTLNEYGEYEFDDSFFPNNQSPSEFLDGNRGLLTKQVVVNDVDATYVLYTHEKLDEVQKAKLEQDWKNFCS